MKKFYFDDEESFLEWNEKDKNFVTAVYDGNVFLCDVLEKDVLYLRDIGFLDGIEIVPTLTIEQQEIFKENYGVEIVIAEKVLKLTSEQLDAIRQYNHAVRKLVAANVMCVFKPYDKIVAFNGERVQDVMFEEDCDGEDIVSVRVDELEAIACPFGLNLCLLDDDCIGIQFK